MDDRLPGATARTGPRYGVLGGTFDPPHLAHLVVAQEVYARLALDRVYFLPAGQPPHKQGRAISPAADRCAMVERAIAGNAAFALSRVDVDRAGPSYTSETLRLLRAAWPPEIAITLILGWDMLLDLPTWHDPTAVVRQVACLAVTHRPGYDTDSTQLAALASVLPELREKLTLVPVPQLAISASDLRARVASGLPVRYLVPDGVAEYIAVQRLYRAPANHPMAGDENQRTESEVAGR
jgi:nicotinate-nucleotide adenylyltransferase